MKGLTTEQIRALKKADAVVFHFRNGEHFIRAIKEDKDEFGHKDREIRIDVQGSITSYNRDLGEVEQASYIENHTQSDKALQTIFSHLKKDDTIHLHWVANNNNGYLDRAGLYQDELYLQIHRNGKIKEYQVGTSVTPNNSAKMIKHTSTDYLR